MTRKTVEANAEAYENLDKVFTSLNGYYATESNKNSNPDIDRLAQEIKSTVNRMQRRSCLDKYFTYICIILLVVGLVILSWNTFEIQYTYALRLVVVYLSPIIDLTALNNMPCLLNNPNYIPETRFDQKLCEYACNKANQKDRLLKEFKNGVDFNQTIFHEVVWESDIPIIETTEIAKWDIKGVDVILESYHKQLDKLSDSDFCAYDSIRPSVEPTKLIERFHGKKPATYFVTWENCNKKTSKILKKLISRPSFLPSTLELSYRSWLYFSKHMVHTKFNQLTHATGSRINLFCQIKGESELLLTPVVECEKECQEQYVNIKQGQIAVISDLWTISFRTIDEHENIIIILGAL